MNENWSMGIVIGDGDVAGYNKFELVYSATQTDYKLTQGEGEITGQQPIVLEHISDTEAPVPARMVESNKLGRFELSVLGTTWDSILSKAHTLNRHIGGADSTAARHAIDGTAEKVRFYILPDGASNTTYFTILSGYVDVSAAYYKAESQRGTGVSGVTGAWFIPVNFTFEPGGEGDPFTLKNSLASSPHFIEFNTSATVADGWNLINTPTPTAETTTYLIGGKSQKLITDNSTSEGMESDAVTASTSTNAVGFFWVATDGSAADDLTIELEDGSNNSIDTAVISFNADGTENGSVSDKNRIGPDGTNWYRVVVSGANTTAANFVLRVYRASGDATQISTYFVDGAYLQTGTLTAPDGWCSTSALINRYDPDVAEGNINYLDVWGVPGDLPGLISKTVTLSNSTVGQALTIGKIELSNEVGLFIPIADSSDFTGGVGWTTTSPSAISIGDQYYSTPTPPSGTGSIVLDTSTANYLKNTPAKLYMLCHKTGADNSMAVSLTLGARTFTIGTASPAALSTWSLVEVGIVNVTGYPAAASTGFFISMTGSGTAGVFSIDALLFMPLTEHIISAYATQGPSGTFLIYNGIEESIVGSYSTTVTSISPIGSIWQIIPGEIVSRYIYFSSGTELTPTLETYSISNTINISLSITPRSSHLLGAD